MTFAITVINQGTLPAASIEVTDYTPAGLVFSDPDWTQSGDVATTTIPGPLLPGESATVEITYSISSIVAPITNTAEISDDDSELYNTTDIDSDPDADQTNDAY